MPTTASGAKRTRVLRPSCDRSEPPPEKANPPRLALWFESAALAFTRQGTGPIASAPPTFPEDRWSAVVVATVLRPSERTALWPTKVGRMRGGASPSPRTTRIANPCIQVRFRTWPPTLSSEFSVGYRHLTSAIHWAYVALVLRRLSPSPGCFQRLSADTLHTKRDTAGVRVR